MRILVGLFLCLLFLASCQEIDKSPKPKDLLSEDEMVDVLTEIALLNGARTYNKNMLREKGIDPYEHLQEKFDVDSSQFIRSNNYYSENYKVYSKIYSRVKERLEAMQVIYDSIREVEERKRDSIRAIEDSLGLGRRPNKDSLLSRIDTLELLPPPVRKDNSRN